MLFFSFVDLWIANEPSLQQSLPISSSPEASQEQLEPIDSIIEIKPFVLEGSVESFDPESRAKELVKNIPRNWCGTFKSFEKDLNIDVTLRFFEVSATGQMVSMQGEMMLGDVKTLVSGNLNAKSDQFELIPLAEKLLPGLEPGGSFIGLQGVKVFGWNSSNLDNAGGQLNLREKCADEISEAPVVRSIW